MPPHRLGLYRFPLRLLLPVLLVAFTLLVAGAVYLDNQRLIHEGVVSEAQQRLRGEMNRSQADLTAELTEGKVEAVRQKLSRILAQTEVIRALVVDDHGTVLAGSRYEWVGQDYAHLEDRPPPDLIQRVRARELGEIWTNQEGEVLRGLYPLPYGLSAGSPRPDRIGLLEISLDLSPAEARAQALVRRQTLGFLAWSLPFAAILALLLHFLVSRRISRLVGATQALAEGRMESRSNLTGADELGQLGSAFDGMADRLAESYRRLAASEQRLGLALDATSDGLWEYRLASGQVYYSPRLERLLGYPPGTLEPCLGAWMERVHPEDREGLQEALEGHLAGDSPRFEAVFRFRAADDRWRWICARGQIAEEDAPDQDRRCIGTFTDISAGHDAEENRRLARLVFENASEAILITTRDNRIHDVNPAYLQITGYRREEVIGRNPNIASSGLHNLAFYQAMWRELLDRGRWEGEIWDRRKTGEAYPKWLSINAIRDRNGRIQHYVGIFSDITQQKILEERLQHLAYHDPLTDLPNRTHFRDRLDHEIAIAHRHGNRLAVLFIDLDRFKLINDTLGHEAGDRVLIEIANRLRQAVRNVDTIARISGDEFTVILTDLDSPDPVSPIADSLIANLQRKVVIQDHDLFIGASIGVSLFPDDGEDAETLVKHADTAMYHAKERGRGNHQFFSAEMNLRNERRRELEQALRQALDEAQFEVYYQPQIRIADGHCIGMEALVRWRRPGHGMVPPADFIPLAEETGLIIPLGEQVLRMALAEIGRLRAQGFAEMRVAVNLSPRQFRQQHLLERLDSLLRETDIPGAALELEITETMMVDQLDHTIAVIEGLRIRGVKVAVDDFGTGYSSLNYLKRFPLDCLKIDKSFVRDLEQNADDAAIVSAIIAMASSLRLSVVAEGVETADQLDFLRQQGCELAQGDYFSEPLPAREFEDYARLSRGEN